MESSETGLEGFLRDISEIEVRKVHEPQMVFWSNTTESVCILNLLLNYACP